MDSGLARSFIKKDSLRFSDGVIELSGFNSFEYAYNFDFPGRLRSWKRIFGSVIFDFFGMWEF